MIENNDKNDIIFPFNNDSERNNEYYENFYNI